MTVGILPFEKMQGSGNDFILIDHRKPILTEEEKVPFVRWACRRCFGVGADGVIFIEKDPELDFAWDFYNADGSRAEMCGNGARCAAVFAHRRGIAPREMTFRTLAGPIRAIALSERSAQVRLRDAPCPRPIRELPLRDGELDLFFIHTGVPHVVVPVSDLEAIDVRGKGAEIRDHPSFAPAGTNVNFMIREGENSIAIRTYERGVEDETLACGTGSVASALVASTLYGLTSPVSVRTRGGEILTIAFVPAGDHFTSIDLTGPVSSVFRGEMERRARWTD